MSAPNWLTKSKFLAGRQCHKRLWQQYHEPIQQEHDTPPVVEIGIEVGRLAHKLFAGGVLAYADGDSSSKALAVTLAHISASVAPAIFEATIGVGRLLARVDILERVTPHGWAICEVKSSTEVKDSHIDDVAFQLYVARECGLTVHRIEIIHVNREYIRERGEIDVGNYFRRADVTEQANDRSRDLARAINQMFGVIDAPNSPEIEPWSHCHDPYTCEFWDRCTADKPSDWIFYLPRLGQNRAEALQEMGVESIAKIPDSIDLTTRQAIIRDAHRAGRPYISNGFAGKLYAFSPPAFYLDFETMSPAIPVYPGTRPYERIPFQWSLHHRSGTRQLTHSGFLADGRDDPREAFATSLIRALGASETPIVVYSHFERSTLEQLAETLKRHSNSIAHVIPRLRDLLAVLREHVYFPAFGCSYSLKDVAPVLAPTVGYDDLEHVADGSAAAWVFERIAAGRCGGDEDTLRRALEEYCRRDTLAMVRIHERFLTGNASW